MVRSRSWTLMLAGLISAGLCSYRLQPPMRPRSVMREGRRDVLVAGQRVTVPDIVPAHDPVGRARSSMVECHRPPGHRCRAGLARGGVLGAGKPGGSGDAPTAAARD